MNPSLQAFAKFKCPQCGGSHFGRDTGGEGDKVAILNTVRCHDEFHKACDWRGFWDEKTEPRDAE